MKNYQTLQILILFLLVFISSCSGVVLQKRIKVYPTKNEKNIQATIPPMEFKFKFKEKKK